MKYEKFLNFLKKPVGCRWMDEVFSACLMSLKSNTQATKTTKQYPTCGITIQMIYNLQSVALA